MGTNQKNPEVVTNLLSLMDNWVKALETAEAAILNAHVAYCEFARALYAAIASGKTTAKAVAAAATGQANMSESYLTYVKCVGRMLSLSPDMTSVEFIEGLPLYNDSEGKVGRWVVSPVKNQSSLHNAIQAIGAKPADALIAMSSSAVEAAEAIIKEVKVKRPERKSSEEDPNLQDLKVALKRVTKVTEQVKAGAVLPTDAEKVVSDIATLIATLIPAEVGSESESFQTVAV